MQRRYRRGTVSEGAGGSTLAEVFANWAQQNILLDSQSLDEPLSQGDPAARKVVEYRVAQTFHMFRSPLEAQDADLREITELRRRYDQGNNLTALELAADPYRTVPFYYATANIERVAALVYGRASLSHAEMESILLVFIQAALVRASDPAVTGILVTANEALLSKRRWFESHSPGIPLNIMNVDEALQFMDLFAKYRGRYYTGPNSTDKRGAGWYYLSFRTKLPAYELPWSAVLHGLPLTDGKDILQALANRFTDLLRAIDEIGFRHYLGADNDTAQATAYHFNYFVILVTGVFDSLARLSLAYHDLDIAGVDLERRKSVFKVNLRDKHFLKALAEANNDLSKLIACNKTFIELFYPLRESIVHRDRLEHAPFEYYGKDAFRNANVMRIPPQVARMIGEFDQANEGEGFSDWGLASEWLHPFSFVRAATRKLLDFCSDFLKGLDFRGRLDRYPEVARKIDEARNSPTYIFSAKLRASFEESHLGF